MKSAILLASLGAIAVGAQIFLTGQSDTGRHTENDTGLDLIGAVTSEPPEMFAARAAIRSDLAEQDDTQHMLRTLNANN